MAQKQAKLNKNRGKRRLLQQHAQDDEKVADADVDEALAMSPVEEQEEVHPPVPASWDCSMDDASVGKFVALEVLYDRPKRRGIAVGQVY